MTPKELTDLWSEMARAQGAPSGMDRRLLDIDAAVSIYACVFWPSGRYGLLIEGDTADRPADGRIPKCRGVRVIHQVISVTPPRTALQVALEDARLAEIFAVLSADLVHVARSEATATAALRRWIDRVAMWQGLFERIPRQGLSEEEQRGLFGELVTLEKTILAALDALAAVSSWTGPEPKNQDFVHGGIGVEVKTSLSKRHSRLVIANEKQLDEKPHHKLLLAHVRLDESAAQGSTLSEQVKRCRGLVQADPVAAGMFEDRLMSAGYLDIHAPLYDQKWLPSAIRYFDVRDAFPRLTEANLPPGVGDIRYTIIADDLAAYEMAHEDIAALLKGQ